MVNTVALAIQQKQCIEQATAFKTGVYTGDMNVDAWSNDQWSVEFEKYQASILFHNQFNQSILLNRFTWLGFSSHMPDNFGHH